MAYKPASGDNPLPSIRPRRSRTRRLSTLALAAGLIIVGVWYANRPATVRGLVTLDNKPLTSGLVRFYPLAGGTVADGRIDEQGRYEIQTEGNAGLASGEYLVTVADNETPAKPFAPDQETRQPPPMPLLIPLKYAATETSGLKVQVRSGSNQINFNLPK